MPNSFYSTKLTDKLSPSAVAEFGFEIFGIGQGVVKAAIKAGLVKSVAILAKAIWTAEAEPL